MDREQVSDLLHALARLVAAEGFGELRELTRLSVDHDWGADGGKLLLEPREVLLQGVALALEALALGAASPRLRRAALGVGPSGDLGGDAKSIREISGFAWPRVLSQSAR
jgi:hypothetical protein